MSVRFVLRAFFLFLLVFSVRLLKGKDWNLGGIGFFGTRHNGRGR